MFLLDVWMSPCSSLPLGLSKNLMRVSSRTCSRTYSGCLRTFLRTKYILLRTIIASIYECDFREENLWLSVISKDISNTHYI